MMNAPSPRQFRIIAILGLILKLIYLLDLPDWKFSGEIRELMLWNYFGSLLPEQSVYYLWWLYFIAFVVGSLLFILFVSWSRWLLLVVIIYSLLLELGCGVLVTAPLENFLGSLAFWFFVVPFVLSFFPPCSAYFDKANQGEARPQP